MAVIISSDSTCDLNADYIEKNNIGLYPIKVILGDKTYLDGIDITPEDIFKYAHDTGELPKTAAGNTLEFTEFFKKLAGEDNTVVHINISSEASAVNNFANEAAKEFGGRVFVVDSKALSTGQGLLVCRAVELRDAGKTAEEIAAELNRIKDDINTSFVVDTLEYLHKGGRCSLISMLGAKFLKIHPYIDMIGGKLTAKKKYMGSMKKCVINYVKDLAELYPGYDKDKCFITHSHCEKEIVDTVSSKVKEYFDFNSVTETVAGSVITSHCGKGTIGVLFFKKQV